jgi:hypothetical protein
VFIPIAVSHSPVNPKTDLIIVLRSSENVTAFPLDGWFTTDIPKLAKKFTIKQIKLDKNASSTSLKVKVTQALQGFYQDENLNLIGGF